MNSSRIFCLSLFLLCVGCTHPASLQQRSTPHVDTTGLQDAVDLATSALLGQSHYTADRWTLVSAQQFVVKGRYVWKIRFKPARLLPKDPSKELIGAGGEVIVNIDQATRKMEIRYGE